MNVRLFIAMPTQKNPRTIKSHKGGRTAVLPARLTPATLAELQRQCAADGITVGDWLERAVWARATRPAEIDVYAAASFGLDSDDVDDIERDCARRGTMPKTMDDWRVLFEMFRAGRICAAIDKFNDTLGKKRLKAEINHGVVCGVNICVYTAWTPFNSPRQRVRLQILVDDAHFFPFLAAFAAKKKGGN